jgi:hypothetical protein
MYHKWGDINISNGNFAFCGLQAIHKTNDYSIFPPVLREERQTAWRVPGQIPGGGNI